MTRGVRCEYLRFLGGSPGGRGARRMCRVYMCVARFARVDEFVSVAAFGSARMATSFSPHLYLSGRKCRSFGGRGPRGCKPPISDPDRERLGASKWDQLPEDMAGLCSSASRAKSVETGDKGQLLLRPLPRLGLATPNPSGTGGICGWSGREGGATVWGLLNSVGATGAAWADMRPTEWEMGCIAEL